MSCSKLSVIIPAYNEASTIHAVLEAVMNVKLVHGIEKEIIVVNDCSTDNSEEEIKKFISANNHIKYVKHEINKGKGASIQTAIHHATGDYIIIQDADLELNPEEINLLLNVVVEKKATVVYGSRFLKNDRAVRQQKRSYYANKFLTQFSNLCSGLRITDMETCYKMIRTDVMKTITIEESRFGFEPEITAKLAKVKGIQLFEVPISYKVRTKTEGKKIGWKDGVRAIWCIVKYNLLK